MVISCDALTGEMLIFQAINHRKGPNFSSWAADGENGVVKLVVRDKKNDTSTKTGIVVGETDKEFSFNFKVENIKILPGTYDVVISKKLLSKFVNKNHNLTYFIALEPDSTFVE